MKVRNGSPTFQGFEEQRNIANLNWGTCRGAKTKYLREQCNINYFKDQKAENKFGRNFANKETQADF